MFYDRLLLITSLKSRLLSSSSFSQLYTSEKLPLRKFRREGLSLTPLIAGLLAACGGGTTYVPIGDLDPKTNNKNAGDGVGYVDDGAVEGAHVFIDNNNDGIFNSGDYDLGYTDADGRVVIPEAYRSTDEDGNYINTEITVDLSGAIDLFTGEKFEPGRTYIGSLPAGADETVISPISTIIDGLGAETPEEVAAVLAKIFGEDSGITVEDINDHDNYQVGADDTATTKPLGSTVRIADAIGRASITLEVFLDENTDTESGVTDFEDIREKLFGDADDADDTGFDAATQDLLDLVVDDDNKQTVTDRIEQAQERVDGTPLAAPDIARGNNVAVDVDGNNVGVNADGHYYEDSEITIDVEDWGFDDPAGNTDKADTELVSITITSITRTATDENDNIITDQNGDPSSIFTGVAAGTLHLANGDGAALVADSNGNIEISADDLVGLYFKPAENQSGVIKITYTVNDGEANSDPAELTFTITEVNDDPSDIQLTGDRSNSDEDRADSTSGGLYVLVDGVIKESNGTDNAGVLSVTDIENKGGTYSLSGTHGHLFEIDANNRLKLDLEDDEEPLADGGIYKITITYTNEGGGTYSENYEIVQGGLYIQPDGTAKTDPTEAQKPRL